MATATSQPITAAEHALAVRQAKAFGLRTVPTPPPATEPAAPAALCSLTLRIAGVRYKVRPIASEADGVIRAFSLKRTGSEAHAIAETIVGPTCDCPSFVWRHDGNGSLCKHLRAARAVGLL